LQQPLPTLIECSGLQFAHLFAKLPWPRASEVTFAVFESSCHLVLSPV